MAEDMIKDTHRILCTGVSIIEDELPEVAWKSYAEVYRKLPVIAGSTVFSMAQFIPKHMAEMCEDLKEATDKINKDFNVDPYSLGSEYSLRFVTIHPFLDGNGRMCRMILNAIVFRYTGVFIPVGESEEERSEYMNIKKRASKEEAGHGEYATLVLKKGMRSLQKMKQKLLGKRTGSVSSLAGPFRTTPR